MDYKVYGFVEPRSSAVGSSLSWATLSEGQRASSDRFGIQIQRYSKRSTHVRLTGWCARGITVRPLAASRPAPRRAATMER